MIKSILALLMLASLAACKPQDPAPLPPEVTAAPTPAAAPAAVAAVNGEAVYKKACVLCHGTGVAGAPKVGDAADWGTRAAQGEAMLFEHAIKGFTGKKGMMPAKGGSVGLSDDEVKAAVTYMVDHSK